MFAFPQYFHTTSLFCICQIIGVIHQPSWNPNTYFSGFHDIQQSLLTLQTTIHWLCRWGGLHSVTSKCKMTYVAKYNLTANTMTVIDITNILFMMNTYHDSGFQERVYQCQSSSLTAQSPLVVSVVHQPQTNCKTPQTAAFSNTTTKWVHGKNNNKSNCNMTRCLGALGNRWSTLPKPFPPLDRLSCQIQ